MKKIVFSLIMFYCCLAVFADEPVEVMVLMKARYDRTELKAFAETSQHDLIVTLKELERQGLVWPHSSTSAFGVK